MQADTHGPIRQTPVCSCCRETRLHVSVKLVPQRRGICVTDGTLVCQCQPLGTLQSHCCHVDYPIMLPHGGFTPLGGKTEIFILSFWCLANARNQTSLEIVIINDYHIVQGCGRRDTNATRFNQHCPASIHEQDCSTGP
uniref:Uncharacterized protein n=1 Tax=Rhipicephalus zambeziensis TaxID=60191 RepID=A0A224YHS8_9ACAR